MSGGIDRAMSVILTVAAVAIASTLVYREFGPAPAGSLSPYTPRFVDNWRELPRAGIVTGDSTAKVQLVEFADFQCPFCKIYEQNLRSIAQRYPKQVSRIFIHAPIPNHQHALPAARAAECAHEQGRFDEMQAALYAKQDSLGLRPWGLFARDAGVRDLEQFNRCSSRTDKVARIDEGMALAEKIQIRGTPTLVVNGWMYSGGLPDSVLTKTIDALLAGKKPPGATR